MQDNVIKLPTHIDQVSFDTWIHFVAQNVMDGLVAEGIAEIVGVDDDGNRMYRRVQR